MRIGRGGWIVVALALGLALVAQAVPYGHPGPNPPVLAEPAWDSPETRALAVRACFDCHSNETRWPWFTRIAPASWLAVRDTREGRAALNLSEWVPGREREGGGEAAETIREGSMPPGIYTAFHPAARLSAAERDALARGLVASLGGGEGGDGRGERGEDDD